MSRQDWLLCFRWRSCLQETLMGKATIYMETNSSRLRQARGAMRLCDQASVYRALLVLLACGSAAPASAQVSIAQLRAWGLETYNEIDRTLHVPGTQLFAETASLSGTQSGGSNGRAYVWPASTQ